MGGFTIEGTSSVTCRGSEGGGVKGAWNETTPICEDILCPPLEPPANGDISCTDENVFGSTCYFVCAPGYQLSGSSLLTCTDDGSSAEGDWDNEEPTCKYEEESENGFYAVSDINTVVSVSATVVLLFAVITTCWCKRKSSTKRMVTSNVSYINTSLSAENISLRSTETHRKDKNSKGKEERSRL